jgi:DNA polymerase/3'-5' exonuclease PolX
MDTQGVARLLREYAQRTSLPSGNPYRATAYFTAADNLAALSQPLDRIIAAGTLIEIPGIGDAIADIIPPSSIRLDRTRALKSSARRCQTACLNYSHCQGCGPTRS